MAKTKTTTRMGYSTPPSKKRFTKLSSPPLSQSTATSTLSSTSTARTKSTTESKKNISKMSSLTMKSSTSPQKMKQRKTLNTSPLVDSSDDDFDHVDEVSLPEAHEIDWSSASSILAALALLNSRVEYKEKSMYERIVLLAYNFSPSDICPVYMLTASRADYDTKSLKMKTLKSMKVLAPELAKISISIINAKTDIGAEDGLLNDINLPANITVK